MGQSWDAPGSSCSPSSVSRRKGCIGGEVMIMISKSWWEGWWQETCRSNQINMKITWRWDWGPVCFFFLCFIFVLSLNHPQFPPFFHYASLLCPDRKARRERKRLEEKLKARWNPQKVISRWRFALVKLVVECCWWLILVNKPLYSHDSWVHTPISLVEIMIELLKVITWQFTICQADAANAETGTRADAK